MKLINSKEEHSVYRTLGTVLYFYVILSLYLLIFMEVTDLDFSKSFNFFGKQKE